MTIFGGFMVYICRKAGKKPLIGGFFIIFLFYANDYIRASEEF